MTEEQKQDEVCIGDLTTHEVKVGQVWRNWLDPTDTKEILEVKSRHSVKVKSRYLTFGTMRESKCEIHDDMDPWISLHSYVLIKEA